MQAQINTYPMRTTAALADDCLSRAMYELTLLASALNLVAIDLVFEEPDLLVRVFPNS